MRQITVFYRRGGDDYRKHIESLDRCGSAGMTDLEKLTVDAARYRWVREHSADLFIDTDGSESAEEMDEYIDRMLESDE